MTKEGFGESEHLDGRSGIGADIRFTFEDANDRIVHSKETSLRCVGLLPRIAIRDERRRAIHFDGFLRDAIADWIVNTHAIEGDAVQQTSNAGTTVEDLLLARIL